MCITAKLIIEWHRWVRNVRLFRAREGVFPAWLSRASKAPACRWRLYSVCVETDWPVEAGEFEPLHFRIGIREDSQPGAAGFELTHLN